jgi:hypothetical protein
MNQLRSTHFPLLAHKFAHPEKANIWGCSAKSNQKIAPKKKGNLPSFYDQQKIKGWGNGEFYFMDH